MEKDNMKTSRANQSRSKSERPKVWVPRHLWSTLHLMDSGTDG